MEVLIGTKQDLWPRGSNSDMVLIMKTRSVWLLK
jgi:hypothetical protein